MGAELRQAARPWRDGYVRISSTLAEPVAEHRNSDPNHACARRRSAAPTLSRRAMWCPACHSMDRPVIPSGYREGMPREIRRQPVRRFSVINESLSSTTDSSWPRTVPAVAQIIADGLDLPPGITILVGENGSGKSTVLELIARAVGVNPEGGSAGAHFSTRPSEPTGVELLAHRSPGAPRWAYFLRDETLHGLYTYLENNPGGGDPRYHELSHGEGLLEILTAKLSSRGFFLLDEPDAALSFQASLALMVLLADLAQSGAQVLLATHSPLLAAIPGAHLLEFGPWGIREERWDSLSLTTNWRSFLDNPESYLRHLTS